MKQRNVSWLGGAALFATVLGSVAQAHDAEWVNRKLKEFEADPKTFINDQQNVSKYNPDTMEPIETTPKFSPESIVSRDFILQKDALQKSAAKYRERQGRAPYYKNDLAENLVDQLRTMNLKEMESSGLTRGAAEVQPWSDDYWPIYKGVIAQRYADPRFPNSKDWATNVNYVSQSGCSVDQLSPAEKYDLLVGDPNRTMTNRMLREGQQYAARNGRVETWMGICHGWAPASFMLQRPTHQVTVRAANGTPITFYPSDIKALASLLWANAAPNTRFIGARCDMKNPPEDANGRIQAQQCFDTNPGTWHLSVVNQLGLARRPFVLDATFDYEVWNQPAYSYSYSYFNPQTFTVARSLSEAAVPRQHFSNDKFRRYRSGKAAYFVGVSMQLVYLSETSPTARSVDAPNYDQRTAVTYLYDLELDSNFNILGGEWYNRQHPDFLWVPSPGARAVSVGDQFLNNPENAHLPAWDGRGRVPQHWTRAAMASSQRGQPLAAIVEALSTLANM